MKHDQRHRAALERCVLDLSVVRYDAIAGRLDAALRSAVRAVLPGRQQQKNLAPLLQQARRAFVRTLRRRAR